MRCPQTLPQRVRRHLVELPPPPPARPSEVPRAARSIQPLCCVYALDQDLAERCPICLEGLECGQKARAGGRRLLRPISLVRGRGRPSLGWARFVSHRVQQGNGLCNCLAFCLARSPRFRLARAQRLATSPRKGLRQVAPAAVLRDSARAPKAPPNRPERNPEQEKRERRGRTTSCVSPVCHSFVEAEEPPEEHRRGICEPSACLDVGPRRQRPLLRPGFEVHQRQATLNQDRAGFASFHQGRVASGRFRPNPERFRPTSLSLSSEVWFSFFVGSGL